MQLKLQDFGLWLIRISVLGFAVAVVQSFTIYSGLDQGALPALSFLLMMIGLAFAFPSLLEESVGAVSTMRIITFAVVMVFCVIYLKIGWDLGNFEQFTIDDTWFYILGLAFGAKTLQKFAEEEGAEDGENSSDT